MVILRILLLLLPLNVLAGDFHFGVGNSWKSDYYGDQTYIDTASASYTTEDWRFTIQHFNEYNRSPWADTNPEYGNITIPKHAVLSVSSQLFDFDVGEVNFFFDLGLSYVDRLSHVNSSHLLFHENVGFRYDRFTVYFSHTSNAGIIPPNTGEDSIIIEYRL